MESLRYTLSEEGEKGPPNTRGSKYSQKDPGKRITIEHDWGKGREKSAGGKHTNTAQDTLITRSPEPLSSLVSSVRWGREKPHEKKRSWSAADRTSLNCSHKKSPKTERKNNRDGTGYKRYLIRQCRKKGGATVGGGGVDVREKRAVHH